MIVGVDAGALSIKDERLKVGVYHVTKNLLKYLCKRDKSIRYKLYSFLPIDKKLMDEFGKNAVNTVLVPTFGWYSYRLPFELKVNPPDVYLGLSQAMPLFTPIKSLGFIYDLAFMHVPEAYPDSLSRLKKLTHSVIKRSSQIITISQTTKTDILNNYYIEPSKVTIAYPGVATIFTKNIEKINRIKPYFLFVGSLKRTKNIPNILKAFNMFSVENNYKYDLILIGSNFWMDDNINSAVEKYNISKYVQNLGFVNDTKLAQYMRGATCLLTPSLWEGFCLPAIEAMACGCPVIGSNKGSLPEIIKNAGLLVDPRNTNEIKMAMNKIVLEKEYRSKLITNGLKRYKLFTWENFSDKVFNKMMV